MGRNGVVSQVDASALLTLDPRARSDHRREVSSPSGTFFNRFGISADPARLHFFIAQLRHERGGLKIITENRGRQWEGLPGTGAADGEDGPRTSASALMDQLGLRRPGNSGRRRS